MTRDPFSVLPSREETQAKLDARARVANAVRPLDAFTLADRLEAQALSHAARPFLIDGDTALSFAQVNASANRYAHALATLGIKQGDAVALVMENRPEYFIVWFALNKLGAICGFINTHLSGQALIHALAATQARAVIAGDECLVNFSALDTGHIPLWRVADPLQQAPAEGLRLAALELSRLARQSAADNPPASLRAGLRAEDTALYICTSGTTGLPKAAKTSHMRWLNVGDIMQVTLSASENDVFYCFLPLYHGAGSMSLGSTALRCGAAIVIRRKFSVREFWRDVRKYRITVCQYIGEICRYLLNQPPSADDREHSLRKMMGAGLSAEVWQRFVARFGPMDIYEGWGSTESNCNIINVDNRVGSCGRIPFWDKTNVRMIAYDVDSDSPVRDEASGLCQQVGPDEVGEVIGFIIDSDETGGGRFEGYTSSEATAQKILRDVFTPGDAWWRSGDLLRYDEDGYCWFVDRIGDTFRWKSENVSTTEVAEALSGFDGLEALTIYGVQVPAHEGRCGMAAVVMQEGRDFDAAAFYRLASARLPKYAVPQFVRVRREADMTSTFKLKKVDLMREGYDPARFSDPLLVCDDKAATYVPYSPEALAQTGLPAFSD
ncbi:long-chain-acyl-CoA synthetase [Craterilacuibacter sp. RT1T]|uniref:long-chain-acyl-CoA synthetase n=1 Tax=Craterilacuibacter sp. RT1T TaxID=2942211 RepID=UPI0020BE919B|nr:long-chain-acyl-CoA synthetase [Craterilacuibacter sp. RT1T]MCL6262992.1 long-chain-acyl-CoA synthetase [Craterilacuibacter sp. RT1T]